MKRMIKRDAASLCLQIYFKLKENKRVILKNNFKTPGKIEVVVVLSSRHRMSEEQQKVRVESTFSYSGIEKKGSKMIYKLINS